MGGLNIKLPLALILACFLSENFIYEAQRKKKRKKKLPDCKLIKYSSAFYKLESYSSLLSICCCANTYIY